MKKLLVLVLGFMLLGGCVSYQPLLPSEREYSTILEFPNMHKQQLYDKSLQAITYSFKSAKAVLEYQNVQEGKIIGNFIVSHYFFPMTVHTYDFHYTLTIYVKAGKIKVDMIAGSITFTPNRGSGIDFSEGWSQPEDYIKI